MAVTTGMSKFLNHQTRQTAVQEQETVSLSLVLSTTHVTTSVLNGTEVILKEGTSGAKESVALMMANT